MARLSAAEACAYPLEVLSLLRSQLRVMLCYLYLDRLSMGSIVDRGRGCSGDLVSGYVGLFSRDSSSGSGSGAVLLEHLIHAHSQFLSISKGDLRVCDAGNLT